MYISIKVLRIIYAIAFIGILYFNYSLSHNENVPDSVNRKVGAISLLALIALTIIGVSLGIVAPSE